MIAAVVLSSTGAKIFILRGAGDYFMSRARTYPSRYVAAFAFGRQEIFSCRLTRGGWRAMMGCAALSRGSPT
jgi:hypothetical protein